MLQKQDITINEIKTMGNKIDNIGNKIDNFTSVTMNNFNILDIKYGLISQNMNKIIGELIKEREESRKSMEILVEAILKSKDNKI
ncbi:MAG: hypothetical protein QMD06_02460 [Candidatus Altarchaeum sp.]|nr:hypothetical protein [Candidatus Altarchaeum sp.]